MKTNRASVSHPLTWRGMSEYNQEDPKSTEVVLMSVVHGDGVPGSKSKC